MTDPKPVRTEEDVVNDLFAAIGGSIATTEDEGITLCSNGGSQNIVMTSEPMTINDALAKAGVSHRSDHQFFVNGVPTEGDSLVAPGTSVFIHVVQEGG